METILNKYEQYNISASDVTTKGCYSVVQIKKPNLDNINLQKKKLCAKNFPVCI